jgi:hypothetical protein
VLLFDGYVPKSHVNGRLSCSFLDICNVLFLSQVPGLRLVFDCDYFGLESLFGVVGSGLVCVVLMSH